MSETAAIQPRRTQDGLRELAAMVRLDLCTIRAASVLVVLLVAGAALFIVLDPGAGVAPLTTIIAVVVTVNLMTASETHRLPLLYGALPVRRRTVITAHYLVAIGATLLAAIPALLSAVTTGSSLGQELWGVTGAVGVTLAVVAILLPAYLALGAQKGGLILIFSAFTIGAAGYLVQQRSGLPGIPIWALSHIEALGVTIGIVLMAISWAVSTAIYLRQDH